MCGASSMSWPSPRRSRQRYCGASLSSMPSRTRCGARRRRNGERCAPNEAGSSSMTFAIISVPGSVRSARRANLPRRSVTRSTVGMAYPGLSTTAAIDLDSNTVERSIRPIALNRKNALFAGSDEGGDNWAVIATLIENCKFSGINPHDWLDWHPHQTRQRPSRQRFRQPHALDRRGLSTALTARRSRGRPRSMSSQWPRPSSPSTALILAKKGRMPSLRWSHASLPRRCPTCAACCCPDGRTAQLCDN